MTGLYIGEINENGKAHGSGEFKSDKGLIWRGTFKDNKITGLCK